MAMQGNKQSYGAVAQGLHWLTAILVLVAFLYGLGGSEARVYLPERDSARRLHESLGLTVLVLVVLRIAWRAFDPAPEEPPMPQWMPQWAAQRAARWSAGAARATHLMLYALLLAVPLSAIIGAWLEGHAVTVYLLGEIAPPLAPSHDLGVTISEAHTWLGDAIMWLAGLHAAAGIGHHFLMGDNVLTSMLPFGNRRTPPDSR